MKLIIKHNSDSVVSECVGKDDNGNPSECEVTLTLRMKPSDTLRKKIFQCLVGAEMKQRGTEAPVLDIDSDFLWWYSAMSEYQTKAVTRILSDRKKDEDNDSECD